MKQSLQIVLVVVILVATVGGVAFVRNWVSTPDPNQHPDPAGVAVYFPMTVYEDTREIEIHGVGHQDFRFQNSNDVTVEICLDKKGCKCSKVEALVLSEDEQKSLDGMSPTAVQQLLDNSKAWQPLEDDGTEAGLKMVTVPAQAAGFVRLKWEAKQIGPERLWAGIWARAVGQPKTRGPEKRLEVPIVVVHPIQINTNKLDILDIRAGQSQSVDFYCYSTTRPGFKIKSVKEKSDDPCFVCTVTQLQGDEGTKAAEVLQQPATRLVCLYRLRLTVHERSPDEKSQLDLGPYQREVVLLSDEADQPELSVGVNGTVRGDVTVGTEESQDRVLLKTFPSNKGKEVTIPVETAGGLKPKKWTVHPDYIKAELTPRGDSGNRWSLKVTVPPHVLRGRVPDDAAVVIEFDTDRRLRIPIVGRATVPLDSR